MWILPPKVRRPLLKGLRSAFPDISEFDSFLLTNCSKERADIVPDTVNIGYPNQIERVLRNAEYKNWSNLLINKACEEQPTNEYLQNAKQLFDAYNAKGLVARVPIDVFSIFQRYSIPILFCGLIVFGVFLFVLRSNCIWPFHGGARADIVRVDSVEGDVIYVREPVAIELRVDCRNVAEIKVNDVVWLISTENNEITKKMGNPIQLEGSESGELSVKARSGKYRVEATKLFRVEYPIQIRN